MAIVLVTAPAVEPVTLGDMKLQLGLSPVEDTDQVKSDQLSVQLRRYLAVARAECENYTRRVFITQTWKYVMDGWPGIEREYERGGFTSILLPKPPFQSLVSFTYTDTSGATQDMLVYGFQTDPGSETQPGRLTPPYAQPWPPLRRIPNSVAVTFKAGYGDTGLSVPAAITQAILFLAQFFYEQGGAVDLPQPRIVRSLLDPYVNRVS